MLRWISIFGGLLIMMGHHARSEALFYYFRLEDQVPENHLLRLIDKYVSFEFVRERLKESYSETGRPSIDPELLLRILLIGYLYGITSERRLVEELRMHLAWRWFTGLSFDQEILTLGLAFTIWTASSGFAALIDGLDIVYRVRETRAVWKTRPIALGLTLLAGSLLLVAVGLMVEGTYLGLWFTSRFDLNPASFAAWRYLRESVAVALRCSR